jgi:hypothetical protein
MGKDLASDFSRLKRPGTLAAGLLRFSFFAAGAFGLYLIAPQAWSDWKAGLVAGMIAGTLWAVSWRWKGDENRLIMWLILHLGGFLFCGLRYRDFPPLGVLASMYVGFEFMQLVLRGLLRRWASRGEPGEEGT